MANRLTDELMVKKALNIDSFRNLSKEKVIEFVSRIPDMDKEVACAIINQFPCYVDNAKIMVESLERTCSLILQNENKSHIAVIESYQKILDDLGVVLLKENISYEERKEITKTMIEIADKISDKDTEEKNYGLEMVKTVCGYFVSFCAIGAGILGVSKVISKYS